MVKISGNIDLLLKRSTFLPSSKQRNKTSLEKKIHMDKHAVVLNIFVVVYPIEVYFCVSLPMAH